MLTRQQIKENAKAALRANYWPLVGAFVIVMLILGASSMLYVTFLLMPLVVGLASFMLNNYRGYNDEIGNLFTVSFNNYPRKLGGMLWMELWIFIWSLALVIPGIIKALAYSMTPFILADCPNVKATDALKLSMRMTSGYKGEIFVFYLSFLGWMILSSITFGLLQLFYVGPYMNLSVAGLYDELKQNALNNGVISEEELA